MIRIFLDQDGVLANFADASVKLHASISNCSEEYEPSSWDYYKDWGISSNEFWHLINEKEDFWHNLEKFEYFDDLIKLIENYDPNFKILTSPTNAENCYAGKFYWLNQNFQFKVGDRAILHSDKSALVKDEDCVLIDDAEHNCEEWETAGGCAILFPQQWNSNRSVTDKVGYVKSELIKYYGDM